MARDAVLVLHDLDSYAEWDMHIAVQVILAVHTSFRYVRYHGVRYHNLLGTGLLIRGFKKLDALR